MNEFAEKYGVTEDENTVTFHQSRRMFCVHQNILFIAEQNLPYSHAVWFEKEDWLPKVEVDLIMEIVRGVVDSQGDIYFYIGYNFEINNDCEHVFFSHLKELVDKLKLSPEAKIFGGLIKSEPGQIWSPVKSYGKISENL
ncbi:MAG: hypothetical protein WC863_00020 [Patescibacteria group bacterium]